MKLTQLLFVGAFFLYAYTSHASCYTPTFISDVELVERIEKYDDKKFLNYNLISGSNYSFDEYYIAPCGRTVVGLRLSFATYPEGAAPVAPKGRTFSYFYDKDPDEQLMFDFEKDRFIILIKIATDNEVVAEPIFYELYRDFLSKRKNICQTEQCYIGSQYVYKDVIINLHGMGYKDEKKAAHLNFMTIKRMPKR